MSSDPESRPRTALVTGGAGFIGSHIVDRLVEEGYRVRVLDDFSSGHERNLERSRDRVELIRADLRDPGVLARAVRGVNLVFHEAAIPSVPKSVSDPLGTSAVNLEGTLALLDAAREAGVDRLVFAASSAAYGEDERLPKVESLPAQPLSPYAVQKHGSELYCALYTRLHGLETVALRYFNVYGPRQDPKSDYAAVIPLFMSAAVEGRPVRIYGDGEQTRDFVFVGDVVEANICAATAPGAAGQVINVASGERTSVNRLVELIGSCVGRAIEPEYQSPRPGDIEHSWADISRAARVLGWTPRTELGQGLRVTADAHKLQAKETT